MTIVRLFFDLFSGMIIFFFGPFSLIVLCREKLIHDGEPIQQSQAVALMISTLLICFLISILVISKVEAGFPYALQGEWQEKEGVFQEWAVYRKPDPQGATILVDGRMQDFSIKNIKRGDLSKGDEVRFLVKPAGDSDIYIAAWRKSSDEQWIYLEMPHTSQSARNKSLLNCLFVTAGTLLAMLARLSYGIHIWKTPSWYQVGTILVAVIVIGISTNLWYVANNAVGHDSQALQSAFHLLVWCCYSTILWIIYVYGRAVFKYNQYFLKMRQAK